LYLKEKTQTPEKKKKKKKKKSTYVQGGDIQDLGFGRRIDKDR
jgi:hypothetical protein